MIKRIRIFFYVGFGCLLIGCSLKYSATQIRANNPILKTTESEIYPIPTILNDNDINLPTRTPWPTPSNLLPTLTPLPTFTTIEAQEVLLDLYQNNPCDLPCWWNIVPGKTRWNDTWQFLGRFSSDRFPSESYPDVRIFESKEQPGFVFIKTYFNITVDPEDKLYGSLQDLTLGVGIDDFVVDYIDVNTGRIKNYSIPEILNKYGEPEQIYVSGAQHSLDYFSGITVWLYYPSIGFISSHFTTVNDNEWNQASINSCFQKTSMIYIWPKNQLLDFQARLNISGAGDHQDFKLIDEVTDFSVKSFYSQFVGTIEQPCISFYTDQLLK